MKNTFRVWATLFSVCATVTENNNHFAATTNSQVFFIEIRL